VPTPIPLSEIASQGESATEFLRNIETSLSTDRLTAAVEKRLPQLTSEIDLRATETSKLLASSLPLEFLHNLEVTLQRFRDELSTENHDLTERAKSLDDQIAQLDKLSKIWTSTLQLPELSQTAPDISNRVQSLIDRIGHTRQAVKSLRERDLTLQGGVHFGQFNLLITKNLQKKDTALLAFCEFFALNAYGGEQCRNVLTIEWPEPAIKH
jgi:chromosome segregation ATPase